MGRLLRGLYGTNNVLWIKRKVFCLKPDGTNSNL
jgi:hypothetical protein